MLNSIDPIWIFSACLFGAIIAMADALYSIYATSASYRKQVNRRLALQESSGSRTDSIIDLRRERGLSVDGGYFLPVIWFNRLIVQSGMRNALYWLPFHALATAALAGATAYLTLGLVAGIAACALTGALTPIMILMYLRSRRKIKFTEQFAEAIEVIVRSLRAGHPVPAAIKLAAREMPDPVGTEFGMAEDEMTFGLDLETAMRNMAERVGQEDLPLFVTSVAIQTSSGGNLTEILDNLSSVIRMRAKMRRKIRALSAEGRISALILSATPIILFIVINMVSPGFYSRHWEDPVMQYGLAGAATWMMLGNLWMRSMINFKI